jgi:hypothetical protein
MPYHSQWLIREFACMHRGDTAPDPTKFYLCLADSATLTAASPSGDFYAAELPIGLNNYTRQAVTFPSAAIFDNATQSMVAPQVAATWTAVGSALQFQTVFLIADGAASGTAGAIVAFLKEPQTRMRLAGQPYTATLVLQRSAGA